MPQDEAGDNDKNRRGIKPRELNPEPRLGPLPYDRSKTFRPDLLERVQAALEQRHGMSYSTSRKGLKAIQAALLGLAACIIEDEAAMKDLIGGGTILLPSDFDESFRNLSDAEVKVMVESILRAVNRRLNLDDDDIS